MSEMKYRELGADEEIQDGDEYFSRLVNQWTSAKAMAGNPVSRIRNGEFRRPINPPSQLTEAVPIAGIDIIRKHLGMAALFESWPQCYQGLARQLSELQAENERLKKANTDWNKSCEEIASAHNELKAENERLQKLHVIVRRFQIFCYEATCLDHTDEERKGSGCPICLGRELTRLKAGGCARDQTTTQFCAEAVALQRRLDIAERALANHGYRKSCDIAACNCGDQWSHGGHASARLSEISDEVWQNGVTTLDSVIAIRDERDSLRARVQELEGIIANPDIISATKKSARALQEARAALKSE